MLTGQAPGRLRRAASMSTFVNIRPGRHSGRMAGFDRSLALTGSPGIQSGIRDKGNSSRHCLARFAQSSTHYLHASPVRDPAVVRGQVRTDGTHSGVRTVPVRTGGSRTGSQPPMARAWTLVIAGWRQISMPVCSAIFFRIKPFAKSFSKSMLNPPAALAPWRVFAHISSSRTASTKS